MYLPDEIQQTTSDNDEEENKSASGHST